MGNRQVGIGRGFNEERWGIDGAKGEIKQEGSE
jgi:hypothetical protein